MAHMDSNVPHHVASNLPEELRGQRILVAVSGGADSVALLQALRALQVEWQLDIEVAHFHHGLRGGQADADASWIESLCADLAVLFHFGREDIADRAAVSGSTIEEAARDARYQFLQQVAQRRECCWIAVAHTADDQAETILHHIIRGTGLAGLRGMPTSRPLRDADSPTLLRPLLSTTRASVDEYLRELGQDYRTDETNQDERFTRNRLRHQLLPLLRREYQPAIDGALLRLGRQAAEIEDAFQILAARLIEASLEKCDASICRINVEPLTGEPRQLVRECSLLILRRENDES
eukprot:g10235.t1